MRGSDIMQESLFMVSKLEDFVPEDHPLRPIRLLVNEALGRMNSLFDTIYADSGRDSIAPEKLLRALLLQIFHSIRSERMLMEQMRYNLLFRWFVGIAMEDAVWNHSVFSKNRDRLLEHEVIETFFAEILALADKRGLLSNEHFCVDGTLIQAWASHKSFPPRTARVAGRTADATPRPTGRDSPAATIPTQARPTRMRGSTARATTPPPS